MAISLSEQQSIIRLAVGMFNAAPGATYMNTLVGIFEANGHNMTALANTLSDLPAFEGIYNDGLTSDQFATAFLSTLNLQNNDFALDWVSSRDEAGVLSRGEIIRQAVEALSTSGATAFQEAKAILNNKVEVATFFTIDQNNPETNLAALQAVLATVTSDPQSVIDAEFGIANPPQTFNLTINADVGAAFTGGEGNDTFNADAALSTVDLILRPTLGGNDDINGKGGFDVLNAVVNGAFGLAAGDAPHITDIEQLNFTVRNSGSIFGGDNEASIDFGHVTGATEVNMVGSDDGSGLDIFNVQEAINIGINGLDDGYMDVSFDDDALGSDEASQLVTIQNVTDSTLNIDANGDDVITDVTLMVVGGGSNDLQLNVQSDGDYSLQHLTIGGGGDLELSSADDFSELVSLNSTGLAGDLEIDISGGLNVESVMTGPGDDTVTVDMDLFDGELEVAIDLGGGDNTLVLTNHGYYSEITDTDLNDIDFSTATISNVQTLALDGYVDLNADAALDVSTIGGLQTLTADDFFGDGYDFALTGPETLTFAVDGEIDEMALTTSGILDLTMTTADGDLDLISLTSEDITSLTLVADDSDEDEDADANVSLDGTDDNLATLATVDVTADGDVNLGMFGEPPTAAVGGVAEEGTLTFSNYLKVNETGKGNTFQGTVTISSTSLAAPIVVDVSGASGVGAIGDAVAAALEAATGIHAVSNGAGVVTYGYDAAGTKVDLAATFSDTLNDGDNVDIAAAVTQQGTAPTTAGADFAGFDGLSDVNVDAGGSANVDIEDAVGNFTATVTAADDANVTIIETGVTSVDVTGDNVDLDVETAADLTTAAVAADDVATVFIQDAESLTTITVAAGDDEGLNTLMLVNTDDVATIDLTNITDNDSTALSGNAFIDVDVVNADFAGAVQILVGSQDMNFHMSGVDGVRETFTFVGSDTGAVVIDNGLGGDGFLASVGGTGDRLDFSQMAGIDALDDLAIVFDDVANATHITSLVDGVNVDITVVGADVSLDAFHFIF
jgi:hypothetical protein